MSDYLDKLDPQQRSAVLAPPTPLRVVAGAGSGKTRVIISRIAHQIDEGLVEPRNFFASAFTNVAAQEMAERIQSLVPAEDLQVATFHSFMYRWINEWRSSQGVGRLGVMKEYDKKRLMIDLLDHPTKEYPDALNVEVDVSEVIRRISTWKNSMIHHYDEEIEETLEDADRSTGLWAAAKVYPIYERIKSGQNKIDFDDMLLMAYDAMQESPEALQMARSKWTAWSIDEAQDTNNLQWCIMWMLAPPGSNPNLTIVGDFRQALFRFRGAIPELMEDFGKMYKESTTIDLTTNYRSTNEIVGRANALVQSMNVKAQKPVRGKGVDPLVVKFDTESDQATEIAELVTKAKEEGYRGGDISVLIRTNAQSVDIERGFVLARHPYWCKGGGFFHHREIADILSYMKLAVSDEDIAPLYRIINKPTRYLGRAFVEAVERNMTGGRGVLAALEMTDSYSKRKLSRNQNFEVGRLCHQIRGLRKDKQSSRDMIETITKDFGYLTWLKKNEGFSDSEENESREDNIDALLNAAWEYERPEDLVAFADMTDKLQMESGDSVEICTVHRAKGREWPIVVVSNFYEDSIPHKMSKREGNEPDERRVAYVAFTRAQDLLVLCWPEVTQKYGTVEPSRYITDAGFDLPEGKEMLWWGDSFDKIKVKQ